MQELKDLIREVRDFPKPGINFSDITTLLKTNWFKNGDRFAWLAFEKKSRYRVKSRRGSSPHRRLCWGKASSCTKEKPTARERIEYALEYGTDVLEIHRDAIDPGQNVLIIDDVLATGGTASACAKLVEKLGGRVAGLGFILELDFLNGRQRLNGYDVFSLLHYSA
jgi:adenine phosphoribosyltransferase